MTPSNVMTLGIRTNNQELMFTFENQFDINRTLYSIECDASTRNTFDFCSKFIAQNKLEAAFLSIKFF